MDRTEADLRAALIEQLRPPEGDSDTGLVAGHLASRKVERRVLLLCSAVGLAGVLMLLSVVAQQGAPLPF